MQRYAQEDLQALAEKIDIVDYIGATEELRRNGSNYFTNCRFHTGDDTASLCIYPDSQRWYCFGCHEGGNIYNWIMKTNNVSFSDAVDKVAKLTGTEVKQRIESQSVIFYKQIKRQLTHTKEEDVERIILDWDKDYFDKFADELPQEWLDEGITAEAMKEYNIRIDHSANRIVYPVVDINGNLIGVKGRTRLKEWKLLKLQKYMNYNKIGTLDYFQGYQQAEIISGNPVIIFEGVKSCMKSWGWGIKNIMAAETSNISDAQLQLLIKNRFSEVIFALDKDQKVQSIASNPRVIMLKKFTRVSAVNDVKSLLGEKDSPVDKGEDVFRQLLNERIKL